MPGSLDRPTIFARLSGKEILGEWGRLLFSLLDAFHRAGCRVLLFEGLSADDLGKYGPLALSLERLSTTSTCPDDTKDLVYLFDEQDPVLARRTWRKKVRVRFDVFSPYWLDEPIVMPYPVHPVHARADLELRVERCRITSRTIKLFFAGETEGYLRNRVHYPEEKLTRTEIVDATVRRMDRLVLPASESEFAALLDGAAPPDRFVLIPPKSFRIASDQWLETLAHAHFFLAPPGFVMPMCHNIVEAMTVGTIPITNYPEWLTPHLKHGETCIAFRDEDDLIAKLEEVLRMNDVEVAAMRQRVLDYCDRHLTADSFVRRVLGHSDDTVTVLMLTDANVVANEKKLSARSVLMRGEAEGWPGKVRSTVRAFRRRA